MNHPNSRTKVKKTGPTKVVVTRTLKRVGSAPDPSRCTPMLPVLMFPTHRLLSTTTTPPSTSKTTKKSQKMSTKATLPADPDPERHFQSHYIGDIPYSTASAGIEEAREAVRMGEDAMNRWKAHYQQAKEQAGRAHQNLSQRQTNSPPTTRGSPTGSNQSLHQPGLATSSVPANAPAHSASRQSPVSQSTRQSSSVPSRERQLNDASRPTQSRVNNADNFSYSRGVFQPTSLSNPTTNIPSRSFGSTLSSPSTTAASQQNTPQPHLTSTSAAPSRSPPQNYSSHYSGRQDYENAAPIRPSPNDPHGGKMSSPIPNFDAPPLQRRPDQPGWFQGKSQYQSQHSPPAQQQFTDVHLHQDPNLSDSDYDLNISRTSQVSSTFTDNIDHHRQALRAQHQAQSQSDLNLQRNFNQASTNPTTIFGQHAKVQHLLNEPAAGLGTLFSNPYTQQTQNVGAASSDVNNNMKSPHKAPPTASPATKSPQFDKYSNVIPDTSLDFVHRGSKTKTMQSPPSSAIQLHDDFDYDLLTSSDFESASFHPGSNRAHDVDMASRDRMDAFQPRPKFDSSYLDQFAPPSVRETPQQRHANRLRSLQEIKQQGRLFKASPYSTPSNPSHDDSLDSSRIKVHGDDYSLESSSYIPSFAQPSFTGVRNTFNAPNPIKDRGIAAAKGQMYNDGDFQADGVHELSAHISDIISEDLATLPKRDKDAVSLNDAFTKKTDSKAKNTAQPDHKIRNSAAFKSTPPAFDELDPVSAGTRDKSQTKSKRDQSGL